MFLKHNFVLFIAICDMFTIKISKTNFYNLKEKDEKILEMRLIHRFTQGVGEEERVCIKQENFQNALTKYKDI